MQGLHLVAELYGCRAPAALLREVVALRTLCVEAVAACGLQPVGELFHPFAGGTDPGITGVVLLAESHLAVHTWPEYGTVTLDVYVCNHGADHGPRAEALLHRLIVAFDPARVQPQRLPRGDVRPG